LLAACFVSYCGFFNQTYRDGFQTSWTRHLEQANIEFSRGLSVPDYLGSPETQLRWEQNGLPTDDLCSENAIMIERGIRYPLVIDPAGQAKNFLLNQFKAKKVLETSFVDPHFRKSLESAVRFGTPLIIRDAEKYDPIMNPVLNREYKRTGGRILITLGDQEIDLSPNVLIVLTASTPSFDFPPDLTSRVTMANFTVTRSSLQSQCLTAALKAERPDVEEKRTDLLKQNGEFRAKLFALENSLLQSLNEAEGSLLDDDKVIRKLEIIKKEAADIQTKVNGAEEDMKQIQITEEMYRPVAKSCSAIFFMLEQLFKVKFFYRYSLNFFLAIFDTTLHANKNLEGVKDKDERLVVIRKDLFTEVYSRTAPGLLDEDRLTFAMELARLFSSESDDHASTAEIERFLAGGSTEPGAPAGGFSQFVPDLMTQNTAVRANDLTKAVPCFADLCNKMQSLAGELKGWMDAPRPEDALPDFGQNDGEAGVCTVAYRELLLVQALRPDRVISKATACVETAMGKGFMLENAGILELAISSQVDAHTPILLFGTKGYDPSTNVQDIAQMTGNRRNMKEISVGAASAFDMAYKAIDSASKSGQWVMIKNVHLAPKSLDSLTKKLAQMPLNPKFRLFLTTEIQEKLPRNLLMNARKFVFEPASGVKESLKRTLTSLNQDDMLQEPAERGRMYLLVAWLHAVVQERLRYTPLGWSKKYEFGEPDLRAAIYTVNQWMTDEAKGKSNLPPDKIPFAALRDLLAGAIYGGRVDNGIDDRLLKSFVDSIFVPETFEFNHPLVKAQGEGMPAITVPEGTRVEQFLVWASELPDKEQPYWIGLPNNAERVLKQSQALELLSKIQVTMTTDDDGDGLAFAAQEIMSQVDSGAAHSKPSWMVKLGETSLSWLDKLPDELTTLEMTAESIKDPMFRFFNREVTVAAELLVQVRQEVENLRGACAGEIKLTNDINALKDDLVKGIVPSSWCKYNVPDGTQIIVWIADFAERVKQYQRVVDHAKASKALREFRVWVGGLMEPSAFFTASRQTVAQVYSVPLEQLRLVLKVPKDEPSKLEKSQIYCTGLRYEGAHVRDDTLTEMEAMHKSEPCTILQWTKEPVAYAAAQKVNLPVYVNCSRAQLLTTVDFQAGDGLEEGFFYERGAAVVCSALGGAS